MAPIATSPAIHVRGARLHNLRNIDVTIPRNQLVVVTGLSGSGKSSLAFDTLFAEGQRRYLDSLSTYTRQFLDQLARPEVDEITGLPPTLSIEQRQGTRQPRSTLATATEIHDFLRLLYARVGTPYCPACQVPVQPQSAAEIASAVLALETGRKVLLLAPLVRGRKGTHADVFEKIARDGFVRARVDGELVDVAHPPDLKKSRPHTIELVVDRIIVKDGLRARLVESIELALKRGDGVCIISEQLGDRWHDRLFSSLAACPECGASLPKIEPRTFSFSSPYGACPTCEGLGEVEAVSPVKRGSKPAPAHLPEEPPAADTTRCSDCGGARLGPTGRNVRLSDRTLPDLVAASVAEAALWIAQRARDVSDPTSVWSGPQRAVAARVLPEIASRLAFLEQMGLGYLTLDRPTSTLSGGEFQRARLAQCISSGLRGVCYILDEPTIGLHPRDTGRLRRALEQLRRQGNSVLVVEHDVEIIRAADWVIDLGPGAGRDGGRVVACGTPADLAANPESVTGPWLTAHAPSVPRTPRPVRDVLTLHNARTRNLQSVTAHFPLAALTAVTGVSGSGKSSLVVETLVPLLRAELQKRDRRPAPATGSSPDPAAPRLENTASIQRLIEIDQSPLGRSARSNPATASGLWDLIRKFFARTREARARGYTAARFSFNARGGRCEDCKGQGTRRIEMNFLPDLDIPCATCNGRRFNRATLQVRFRGRSIAEVLDLRIDEAVAFFDGFATIRDPLATFVDLGLGYLTLGQSATTLSGGEAQRIRLATELSRGPAAQTLFVLDEPTTGLHPADVERLISLLHRLVDQGHTVIVIEHHLDVIRAADWLVDLGPDGGPAGGRLLAEGAPQQVAAAPDSITGAILAQHAGGAAPRSAESPT